MKITLEKCTTRVNFHNRHFVHDGCMNEKIHESTITCVCFQNYTQLRYRPINSVLLLSTRIRYTRRI